MGWIDVSPREELMSLGRLEGVKAVSRVTQDEEFSIQLSWFLICDMLRLLHDAIP